MSAYLPTARLGKQCADGTQYFVVVVYLGNPMTRLRLFVVKPDAGSDIIIVMRTYSGFVNGEQKTSVAGLKG